jgi:hypothetical protein
MKLSRFRKPKAAYSLLYVEYRSNTIQAISYIHINIYRLYVKKWDWWRILREEEKKERKRVNNNEIYHICVETRHSETH